ncbi:hypothetical protein R3P38DRAFT_496081 [Favolaschia claudopus]|uniref:Uncharacterized protein n=1 Tax=Favolaschia claudopus TaxID=2862362 RepID=A0AAW0CMI7_9AGAR
MILSPSLILSFLLTRHSYSASPLLETGARRQQHPIPLQARCDGDRRKARQSGDAMEANVEDPEAGGACVDKITLHQPPLPHDETRQSNRKRSRRGGASTASRIDDDHPNANATTIHLVLLHHAPSSSSDSSPPSPAPPSSSDSVHRLRRGPADYISCATSETHPHPYPSQPARIPTSSSLTMPIADPTPQRIDSESNAHRPSDPCIRNETTRGEDGTSDTNPLHAGVDWACGGCSGLRGAAGQPGRRGGMTCLSVVRCRVLSTGEDAEPGTKEVVVEVEALSSQAHYHRDKTRRRIRAKGHCGV